MAEVRNKKDPTAERPRPEGTADYMFNCADLNSNCNWTAHGSDPEAMRREIAEHGRQHHGIKEMGEETWERVKRFIHRKAA